MKKLLTLVLTLTLCVSALSVAAFAAEGNASDYYLFGYINGADHACAEDWENLGEYKFVNGKLTATFETDSYIAIKTGDNENWFMTQAYCTDTTGTFVSTDTGSAEKMFVPGGVELTFSLTVNSDGSLTVSYSKGTPALPVDPTYYVAGCKELCGSEWNADDPANKMIKGENGIYSITYKDVPADKYAFKITDGTWENSWGINGGSGNYVFEITEAQDVTIRFDSNAKIPVAYDQDGNKLPKEEEPPCDYYVAGCKELCGSDWVENDPANKMTKGENGIYSITYKDVPAGAYIFKITDGTWNNSWGINGGDENFEFEITLAQDITICFDSVQKRPYVDQKYGWDSYYVAGCKELCGSEWDAYDSANGMIEGEDGIYRITYKNLPAGKYAFKITDGCWDHCWGINGSDEDFEFEIDEAQDITIEFIPSEGRPIVVTKDGRLGDVSLAVVSVVLLVATAGLVLISRKKKKI